MVFMFIVAIKCFSKKKWKYIYIFEHCQQLCTQRLIRHPDPERHPGPPLGPTWKKSHFLKQIFKNLNFQKKMKNHKHMLPNFHQNFFLCWLGPKGQKWRWIFRWPPFLASAQCSCLTSYGSFPEGPFHKSCAVALCQRHWP